MSRSIKVFTVVTGTMVALSVAAGAQALPGKNTVDSGDIINGMVKRADVAADAINGSKIADGTITAADLAANAVTGAKVADNTLTGADVKESTLDLNDGTCSLENVHSFALIKGSAGMPADWTSSGTYVDVAHNCSGGTVQVKRNGAGDYQIRFNGDPALLGVATPMWNGGALDNFTVLGHNGSAGAGTGFRVVVRNHDGAAEDGWVNVMTY